MSEQHEHAGALAAGRRLMLLRHIGALWRGDWSGYTFDGRDGQRWIETAISGAPGDLTALEEELKEVEESY